MVRNGLYGCAKEAFLHCERGSSVWRDMLFRNAEKFFLSGCFLLMRCVSTVWHDALKIVYLRPDVLSDANRAFSRTYGWAEVRARWSFVRLRATLGHCLHRRVITQPYDVWRCGKDAEQAHV